jgi:hypothetical protein
MSSLRRNSGVLLETTVDAVGTHVVMDDGILVVTDDVVRSAQVQGASITCFSFHAVRFGLEDVLGLQSGDRAGGPSW